MDEFNTMLERITELTNNILSTYIDAPRVGGGVYHALQISGDVLTVRQQLRQGLRAQNVPKWRNIILSCDWINVSYQ